MQTVITNFVRTLAVSSMLLIAPQVQASDNTSNSSVQEHSHDSDAIYKGKFDDSQIEKRTLSDWEGDWQSVYPYLVDGTLDPVMASKAEHGEKTAAAYRKYYETGYRTDVDHIIISGDSVTFHKDGKPLEGQYKSNGHEILTYEAGNRGVRYIFEKTDGDDEAPKFIQFSDHRIAPEKADHYHLYWGNDRSALLKEVTNWPTFYPAPLSGKQIADQMMAH